MARGWHYTKLSLKAIECPSFIFFWHVLCVNVPLFLSFFVFCLFLFCFVFMLSLEFCRRSSGVFLSSRPRTGLAISYFTVVWLRPDRLM